MTHQDHIRFLRRAIEVSRNSRNHGNTPFGAINEQNPTFDLPCREVFARGQKDIEVIGPVDEVAGEAAKVHEGYWD